jgi:hypothetical protein
MSGLHVSIRFYGFGLFEISALAELLHGCLLFRALILPSQTTARIQVKMANINAKAVGQEETERTER